MLWNAAKTTCLGCVEQRLHLSVQGTSVALQRENVVGLRVSHGFGHRLRTAVRVRGDQDVAPVVDRAELAQQMLAHHQELRHRFGRLARLADDVEQRALDVELREEAGEGVGIDRVGDDDAERLAGPREPGGQGTRPERRAADAEDDQRVELRAHRRRGLDDVAHVVPALGQLGEAELSRRASGAGKRRRRPP